MPAKVTSRVPNNQTVIECNYVTVKCIVIGEPEPTIHWQHNSFIIGKSSPRKGECDLTAGQLNNTYIM